MAQPLGLGTGGQLQRCLRASAAAHRVDVGLKGLSAEDPLRPYRCEGGYLRVGLLYRTGHWVTATASDLQTLRDVVQLKTYLDLRNGQDFESVDACLARII